MSLRRLLGLSSAATAFPGLRRRSLTTSGTPPPWAFIERSTEAAEGLSVRLGYPPSLSTIHVPKHLVRTCAAPDHDTDVIQSISGSVCSASSDGLLLLSYLDLRLKAPILAQRGAARLRKTPAGLAPGHGAHCTHFVCNPVTGELSRLPDLMCSDPVSKVMCGYHAGLLTRSDGGRDGPPDRFAVAELHGNQMVRFLSETEEWETVPVSPCQLPDARRMVLDHDVVAFGGRLWWLDVTCGAISADPFSDRPDLCFVELPKDSVLPAAAQDGCGCAGASGCGRLPKHRRLCVSEGRLRYIEVSREEPFVLSTFALDEESSGWTLQHQLDLSRFRFQDCPHPWLPLKEGNTPQIGFLDPLDDSWMYMSATIATLQNTPQVTFVVDMKKEMVITSSAYRSGIPSFVPCVLPPWLGSSQIPSAGSDSLLNLLDY
ncbi:hypothetical protein ACQ4PT_069702 [Festuca glaucescens]